MSGKYQQAPYAWSIWSLRRAFSDGPFSRTPDGIIPARPLGFDTLGNRVRMAWAVFTGRADALYWPSTPKEPTP